MLHRKKKARNQISLTPLGVTDCGKVYKTASPEEVVEEKTKENEILPGFGFAGVRHPRKKMISCKIE